VKIEPGTESSTPESYLKRELGLFQVVMYGVGNIIGAGIYVLIGGAAGLAGNLAWLAFVVGALVALFTGLSYAELASMYPKAASEYVYVGRAYGNRLLSFLTQWTMLVTEIVAAATVSLGFAGYLSAAFNVPIVPTAVALLVVLTLVVIGGVRESFRLNTTLSVIAIVGLLIVIVAAVGRFGSVPYIWSPNGSAGVLGAVILVFFAYIGFDNIANIAEDTRRPETTIPRALLIAVGISTALYVLVGLAAVSLVPWNQLASSEAPLALAVSTVFGQSAFEVLTIIALSTTLNTVLVLLMVGSRIIYGMAREGALPKALGKVGRKTRTPYVASGLVLFVALAFIPLGGVGIIARITSFGSLTTFALVNLALLHLRRVAPSLARPFRIPVNVGWISVTGLLGLISCLALLSQFDLFSVGFGLLLPVSGAALYLSFSSRTAMKLDLALHQEHER
jgi:basic amino acid/polyamine antiporter, APA family